jgi:hypothetical protein
MSDLSALRFEIDRWRAATEELLGTDTVEATCDAVVRLQRERQDLLAACEEIDTFAWSAMTADCEEARVELNRRITQVRAAIEKARTK